MWVIIFKAHFRCQACCIEVPLKDAIIVYPVIIKAVHWDINIKSNKFTVNLNNYFLDNFVGTFFVLYLDIFLGYVTK